MFTYKIKINKVKGRLNESVRRNGITLRIKSAKKLSKNTLFEKADSYLDENYGVRLVEAKFRPHWSPVRISDKRKVRNDAGEITSILNDYKKKMINDFNKYYLPNTTEIKNGRYLADYYTTLYPLVRGGYLTQEEYDKLKTDFNNDLVEIISNLDPKDEILDEKIQKSIKIINANIASKIDELVSSKPEMYDRFVKNYPKLANVDPVLLKYNKHNNNLVYNPYNKKNRRNRREASEYNRRHNTSYEYHWEAYDYDIDEWIEEDGHGFVFVKPSDDIENTIIKDINSRVARYGSFPKIKHTGPFSGRSNYDDGFSFRYGKGVEYRVEYRKSNERENRELRDTDPLDYEESFRDYGDWD